MDFRSLIELERDRYLTFYRQVLQEWREKYEDVSPEILVKMDNDSAPELYLLYRYDLLFREEGKIKVTEANMDTILDFERQEYLLGETKVMVEPFYWNGCEIRMSSKPTNTDFVEDWIRKWLDTEDINPTNEEGFSGTIHNCTQPEEDETYSFSVDLGTAPAEALVELLLILSEQNISEVLIKTEID